MGEPKKSSSQCPADTIGDEAASWCMAHALHGSMGSADRSGEGKIRNGGA